MDKSYSCTLFLIILFFIITITKCSEVIDRKTKDDIARVGRKIFGASKQQTVTSFDSEEGKTLNPIETWKLWQTIDRRNKLQRRLKKENKKREQKERNQKKKKIIYMLGKPFKTGSTIIRRKGTTSKTAEITSKIPKFLSGFSMVTSANIRLERKLKTEIHDYETIKEGSFKRGSSTVNRFGRFEVPLSGIYQFNAIIHISVPKKMKNLQRKDFVIASLCINGKCREKIAITSISGLDSNSRLFSISLSGLLYLKARQYVSMFVTNKSPQYDVNVLKGSYFSGMLMGV